MAKETKDLDSEFAKQARSALINLVFPSTQIDKVIKEIMKDDKSLPLETLIRKSLKLLTKI